MSGTARVLDVPARALMSLLFLVSGFGKLSAIAATQAYMRSAGVPDILVWPAAAFEIGAGLMLLAGFWVRPLAIVLAMWCVATALVFHTAFHDQMQLINFLKNMAMAGGFLALAETGAPTFGIDGLLAARKDSRQWPR